MPTIQWLPNAAGEWSAAANWDANRAPTASDDATLSAVADGSANIANPASANSVALDASTLTVGSALSVGTSVALTNISTLQLIDGTVSALAGIAADERSLVISQGSDTIIGNLNGGSVLAYGSLSLQGNVSLSSNLESINAIGSMTIAGDMSGGGANVNGLLVVEGNMDSRVVINGVLTVYGNMSGPASIHGTFEVDGSASGLFYIYENATAKLLGDSDASILFADASGAGTLILASPQTFTGSISGVSLNSVIDFADTAVSGITFGGNTLSVTVSDGSHFDISVSGDLSGYSATFADDGHGGTLVTWQQPGPTWQANATGDWSDPTVWTAGAVPTAADNVSLVSIPDGAASVGGTAEAHSLQLFSSALSISGTLTAITNVSIDASSTLTLNGGAVSAPLGISNSGTIYSRGSDSITGDVVGGQIWEYASLTINGSVNDEFNQFYGSSTVNGNFTSSIETDIRNGGSLTVDGDFNPTVAFVSGSLIVHGNLNAQSTSAYAGSVLVSGAATGIVYIYTDGTAELGAHTSAAVQFFDGGRLVLDDPSKFTGSITGFSLASSIDLGNTDVTAVSYSGTTLTVTESNSTQLTLEVSGSLEGDRPVFTSDGHGGTIIGWVQEAQNWKLGAIGDWSNAANWVTGSVPVATDDIALAFVPSGAASISGPVSIRSLSLSSSELTDRGTLTLASALSLANGSSFIVADGVLTTPAGITFDASSLLSATGTSTITGDITGNAQFSASGNLTVNGSIADQYNVVYGTATVNGNVNAFSNATFGSWTVTGNLSAVETDVFGSLKVGGTSTGSIVVPHGGLVELSDSSNAQVTFQISGEQTLILDAPDTFSGHIALYSDYNHQIIDLANTAVSTVAFDGAVLHVTKTNGTVLDLSVSHEPLDKILDGSYVGYPDAAVTFYGDGHGGTAITWVPAVNGSGIDGYIAGATVFSDSNNNGVWDAGEVKTTTDANGGYLLPIGTAPIVLTGGVDIATGRAFTGTMKSLGGSTTITPLSTLVSALVDAGATPAAANAQVAAGLGLAFTIDLANFDPIAATLSSDPAQQQLGTAALKASIEVQNTIAQAAAVIDGAGAASDAAYNAVVAALASGISAAAAGNAQIDLTNSNTIATVLADASQQAGGVNAGAIAAVTSQAAAIIVASNAIVDQSTGTGGDLLVLAAQVSSVAQGDAAPALAAATVAAIIGDTTAIYAASNNFTGSSLSSAVAAATVVDVGGAINVPPSFEGGHAVSLMVAENTTAVTTVMAHDPDSGQTLRYGIITAADGGALDDAKFSIDAVTGTLSFVNAPDFEDPTDAGHDNVYNVTVKVEDGQGGTDYQNLAVTVSNTNEAPVFTTGDLAAYYSFDSTTGGVARDLVGGHDGTINGATTVPGISGNALAFAGGAYLSVSDSPAWSFGSNDFSISVWVNFNAVPSGPPEYLGYVLVAQDDGGGWQNKWVLDAYAGTLGFHINDTSGNISFLGASFDPTPGQWYLIDLTKSGTMYSFYANGALLGTATGPLSVPEVSAPLTLGISEGIGQLAGSLDGLAIYERALSAAEVQQSYESSQPIPGTPAVGPLAYSIAENTTTAAKVIASDPDAGQTLTYSIVAPTDGGAADGALFTIDAATGALSFISAPNYEHPTDAGGNNTYDVTVKVDDGHGGVDTQAVSVAVTNVNDTSPTIASPAVTIGTDGKSYVNAANFSGGVVPFAGTAEPGTTVTVSDGVHSTFATVGNDGIWSAAVPGLTDGTVYSFTATASDAAGHATLSTTIGFAVLATNPSPPSASLEFDSGISGDQITNTGAVDLGGRAIGGVWEYSANGGPYLIAPASGTINFSGDGLKDVLVRTRDVAGNVSNPTAFSFTLDTMADTGQALGVSPNVATISGSRGAVGFTVTGLDADASAVVTFADGVHTRSVDVAANGAGTVDLSSFNDGSVTLSIAANDTAGNSASGSGGTLTLLPTNTAPVVTSNGGGATASVTVAENTTAVTSVLVTDPEVTAGTQTLTYSLSGADASLFTISSVGALRFNAAPDFEKRIDAGANGVYDVTVTVSDGHGGTDTQALAIAVTNVDEATTGGSVLSYVVNGSGNSQTVALADAKIFDDDLVTATNATGQANPTYQWQYSTNNGSTWTNIAGATSSTYMPNSANLVRPLHVVATYSDDFGAHTVTSQAAVIGSSAANTLQGTTDADLLIGLNGNDTYVVDNPGDQVVEGSNGGTDTVRTSLATYVLQANVENLTFIGSTTTTSFNWTGNALGNVITSSGGTDILTGGAGDDTLSAGTGIDVAVFTGTVADHTFTRSIGNVVVQSAADGKDTLIGIEEVQFGTAVYNLLYGNGTANTLQGTSSADLILGFGGNDTASYAGSASGVAASLANAAQNTGDAAGDVYMSIQNLTGGAGSDKLLGDANANRLAGGGGADILTGNAGIDTFVFAPNFGKDVITDFRVATTTAQAHDVIEFSKSVFADWAHLQAAISDSANGAVITLDANDTITLTGVTKAQLVTNHLQDFHFV